MSKPKAGIALAISENANWGLLLIVDHRILRTGHTAVSLLCMITGLGALAYDKGVKPTIGGMPRSSVGLFFFPSHADLEIPDETEGEKRGLAKHLQLCGDGPGCTMQV